MRTCQTAHCSTLAPQGLRSEPWGDGDPPAWFRETCWMLSQPALTRLQQGPRQMAYLGLLKEQRGPINGP